MIYVSRALIHGIISISKLIDAPLDSVNINAKNLEEVMISSTFHVEKPEMDNVSDWYYPYKTAAFEACDNLERLIIVVTVGHAANHLI